MKNQLESRLAISLNRVYEPGDTPAELERLALIFLGSFFQERGVNSSKVKVKVKIVDKSTGIVDVTIKIPGGKK